MTGRLAKVFDSGPAEYWAQWWKIVAVTEQPEHELATFLAQDLAEIASEYDRIYKRSTEDSGTAGDEGEGVWATLLRDWLPGSYEIRTKGRILGANGDASPQVDIVVLRPGYPKRLLDKKLYLAGGVAAIFECKNTLTSAHIDKTWQTVAAVNELADKREPRSPMQALVPSIYYGLLTHGHTWNKAGSDPHGVIEDKLQTLLDRTPLMRNALSILCVANLAAWDPIRVTYEGPELFGQREDWESHAKFSGASADEPFCRVVYRSYPRGGRNERAPTNPLGVLISTLIRRLAFSDNALGPLAVYFSAANISGALTNTAGRVYALGSQMPLEVINQIQFKLTNRDWHSDWGVTFNF